MRRFVLLPFVLLALSLLSGEAHAVTRWVRADCANNGDGTANNCAASPGATGAYSKVSNLSLAGLGGGDIVNFFCDASPPTADTTNATFSVNVAGSAGNNLILRSDPTSCGTPTIGPTANQYRLTGVLFKFSVVAAYVTISNFEIKPGAGVCASEKILISGTRDGVTVQHNEVDGAACTNGALDAHTDWIYWSQGTGNQGIGANDTVAIKYNVVIGAEMSDGGTSDGEVGIRHVSGGGTVNDLDIIGNWVSAIGGTCTYVESNGTSQTFTAEIAYNSYRNCGDGSNPNDGRWLFYLDGSRVHAHHNYGDCTDAPDSCGGGWRTRSGGSLVEWNYGVDLASLGINGHMMAHDGTCDYQCTEKVTWRHNIIKGHASSIPLQCFRGMSAAIGSGGLTIENNSCHGARTCLFFESATGEVLTFRNNVCTGTGGVATRPVVEAVTAISGTVTIGNNLFDWVTTIEGFLVTAAPTTYATIALAAAGETYVQGNNKGGQGVDETKIFHDIVGFTPAFPNSGAFGFASMTDGETNHQTGWGADISNAHPSAFGRPVIGAVTGRGFPCVGAYELAKNYAGVPTKFCESR